MKPAASPNRKIVVMAEGDTERAARPHLKEFLDARAGGRPKVRLEVSRFDGALREAEVRGRAQKLLSDPGVIGLVALLDLYPQFRGEDVPAARKRVAAWMPDDPRCRVHFAKHDFEAWLLPGWSAIIKQSRVRSAPRPWGTRPEDIDQDKPPAHRLAELFRQGQPPRRYKKPIDGRRLFEQLDLEDVAACCPEFKAFLNSLLALAEYEPLS